MRLKGARRTPPAPSGAVDLPMEGHPPSAFVSCIGFTGDSPGCRRGRARRTWRLSGTGSRPDRGRGRPARGGLEDFSRRRWSRHASCARIPRPPRRAPVCSKPSEARLGQARENVIHLLAPSSFEEAEDRLEDASRRLGAGRRNARFEELLGEAERWLEAAERTASAGRPHALAALAAREEARDSRGRNARGRRVGESRG